MALAFIYGHMALGLARVPKKCSKTCTKIQHSTQALETSRDGLCSLKTVSYVYGCQGSEKIRVYPMDHLQFVGA